MRVECGVTETATLIDQRPASTDPDAIMDAFLEAMIAKGLDLYPAQEEAILELMAGKHVILNTPTGSGKSLVALALHFKALCEGKRCFYTSPIKALVSEKFFALCDELGAENVGMMTGDASINKSAPIVCCTAEILSNIALAEAEEAVVDYVVMDEFHYFSDRDRGVAWQIPLLILPQTRFLLMSATLGDVNEIKERIEEKTAVEVAWVKTSERPVPLSFTYSTDPIHETIDELLASNKGPIYVVNFTQRECAEQAQNLTSVNFTDKATKDRIKEAVAGFRFDTAYGKDMKRYIMHGIGLHHAGLLPKYRLLVEQLSQQGLLKVICGTDTLGVGVNIPIRTVLFSKLCKFDGEKTGVLPVRDFKQIAGRAGRKGFDDHGYVVCQAPEHVIENLKMERRLAGSDDDKALAKKRKKMKKKEPPTKGYAHWDEQVFAKLQERDPEPLVSRFQVTHGMLFGMLHGHPKDGWHRLMQLIDDSFEDDKQKEAHKKRADELLTSLHDAGLVDAVRGAEGEVLRVVVDADLQIDFSLNQSLSLFLVEALFQLDPASESYALDVMSLVESILENPRMILLKQVDIKKRDKVNELKAAGVEYDQRMEELEKITYDKPLADFIYNTFNAFAEKHPWVTGENIRPKSIARHIYEQYMSFLDYVREFELNRSEGLLLRHLSQAYRTLAQNVPERFFTDELIEMMAFFRTMLARVDSSLIEEWESLIAPDEETEEMAPPPPSPLDFVRDDKAFKARVRAEIHALVKALAEGDWDEAASSVRPSETDPWDAKRFEQALAPFLEEHERLLFDHSARLPTRTRLSKTSENTWSVVQTLVDPADNNDWAVEASIDLEGWTPAQPLLSVVRLGL